MIIDREHLRTVLLEHQRLGPSSCTCGQLQAGSSFADHVLHQADPEPDTIEVLGTTVVVE